MSQLLSKGPPQFIVPARNLQEVTQNCDEDAPLESGDPRWQDFAPARGDYAMAALRRELEWRKERSFVHAAFVSHRGAGKSTEILRLTADLMHRYETLYLPATLELDPFDIEMEDLLLSLAAAVEAHLRSTDRPLPGELLEQVANWFNDIVRTTKWGASFNAETAAGITVDAGVPFLGKLFGGIKALFKQESEYRTEVKQVLKKYPGALLTSVNRLLDAAAEQVTPRELLVVIDNLDRYSPEVIDRLLIQGSDRIRSLHCNLILTPPISLLLRPMSEQLDTFYGCHILYAVRIRRPDQRYDEFDGPGRDLMEQALRRRIDLDRLIPDRTARDRLIAASGGSIREMLDLVSQAAFGAAGEIIERVDVERVLGRRKQRLRDLINANGWMSTLVEIGRRKQIFKEEDSMCLEVLFHRLAFKYNQEGWYDIHPLIAELPEFKDAAAARNAGT